VAHIVDKETELTDHLAELRTRIIRAVVYILAGTIVGWLLYDYTFRFITGPVADVLIKHGQKFQILGITEPFMIRFQTSLVSGVALALPLVTLEIWGFIKPALTKEERRPLRWIVPLSISLFAMGVALAYFAMPSAVKWLVSYVPPNADFRPDIAQNMLFIIKMLLAFGVVFELPVVLMFLGKVGILSSKTMKQYWRQAVVGIAALAAVATPSNDWFTMSIMAAPLIVLYLLSILLVRMIEKR
jgi:sec-independent protein translocase protein TatC